jgi:hypothetical protein
MSGTAERTLILYAGAKPEVSELTQIVAAVERSTGISLEGTRLSTFPFAVEPDAGYAQAFIVEMEGTGDLTAGALERTIIHELSVNGTTRVVAVVKAAQPTGGRALPGRGDRGRRERNAWARELIPKHLAKLDNAGTSLAWLPGWAALTSEHAISFVTHAKDGELMGFADVRILVSLFRETEPERIQKRMPGGYEKFLGKVADRAGVTFGDGQPDLAHWILCADRKLHVVHLAYLPVSGKDALVPWDLMTPDEQQKLPRIK